MAILSLGIIHLMKQHLLKDIFFEDTECVVQYHPPKSEYVNNIPFCLHLWKPIEEYAGVMPMPPSILVGIKGIELGE